MLCLVKSSGRPTRCVLALSERVIQVKGLVKYFGEVIAVNNLSFEVRSGEVYGLLGPNGAGKTTTVKIICGLLKPTSGEVKVFGISPVDNPIEVKKRIGYVPEDVVLYESLTPRELFEFISSVRNLSMDVSFKIGSLVDAFNIRQYYDSPIATLSTGTKQKVAIIAALLHDPPLLVLDEPLRGLDVRSSKIFKELLSIHIENGGAVLLSTHIMELAEHLCTRVGIIDKGRLVAEGTVDELRQLIHKAGASLEEIFLKTTEQEEEVAEVVSMLREAFGRK